MAKKFKKNKEDFVCEFCKETVIGTGYTNHCPNCLYSKHVDVHPGDRLASCTGLMKPVAVSGTQKEYIVTQKCLKCSHVRKNRVADNDSIDALAAIARNTKV